ncbi:MAG: M14 family metallopeptidase [Armatimonadota bacterium]
MMDAMKVFRPLGMFWLLLLAITLHAENTITPPGTNLPNSPHPNIIQVLETPGTNIRLQEQVRDNYLIVELTSNIHNMWMMKLSGVKGKALTIGFSMAEKGNVGKWSSLQPVYTYADPNKLPTFEWFTKDAKTGVWRSGNALLPGDQRDAGKGKAPRQSVVPRESAEEFLAQDGSYWEPWGRITKTQADAKLNIFRLTAPAFTQDEVWIAMRYPFTYGLLQEYIAALHEVRRNDLLAIRTIGASAEGRDLFAIEVKSSRFFHKQPFTILAYAREHPSEPDGSWALFGMLNAVLNGTLEKWPRLILLPMVDPDGVVAHRYEGMIRSFGAAKLSPESTALQSYAKSLARDGKHPDVSLSLHNVESNEANNLWMPHADYRWGQATRSIKARVENLSKSAGYSVTSTDPEWTFQGNRFEGWLSKNLGCIDLVYELNSQAQDKLSLQRLQELGALLVKACDESYLQDGWFEQVR